MHAQLNKNWNTPAQAGFSSSVSDYSAKQFLFSRDGFSIIN